MPYHACKIILNCFIHEINCERLKVEIALYKAS